MADVRRAEELGGIRVDEQLLLAGRGGAPDRQPPSAVMVVHEHEEAALVAVEERGGAMARALARLRQRLPDRAEVVERSHRLPCITSGGWLSLGEHVGLAAIMPRPCSAEVSLPEVGR